MIEEKYLFKVDGKLRILSSKILDRLTSNEVLVIALQCLEEQEVQLIKDAQSKKDKCFYGRKVVEALGVTIKKLEEKFPHLKEQVSTVKTKSQSN